MRTRNWNLRLSCVVTVALLGGCSLVGRPGAPAESPRKQMENPAGATEIRAMQVEQAGLKQQTRHLEAQLKALQQDMTLARQERKRFQETMVTNFALLEKSVSMSLADLMARRQAAAPATSGRNVSSKKAAGGSKTRAAITGKTQAGAPVPPRHAFAPGPRTLPPEEARPAAVTAQPMHDGDLSPPAQPRQLKPHQAAKPLYEKAFGYFARREYDRAIEVYRRFGERFPNDIYADNAQFWVGESYFQQARYADAELAYREVLRNFEHRSTLEGYKTPDAIYRIGATYLRRNDGKRAGLYFANVARRFPETSAGRKAKRELDTLKLNIVDADPTPTAAAGS